MTLLLSRCVTKDGVCGCRGSGGWASRTFPSATPTRSAPNSFAFALMSAAVSSIVTGPVALLAGRCSGFVLSSLAAHTPLLPPTECSTAISRAARLPPYDQFASVLPGPLSVHFFLELHDVGRRAI